MVTRSCVGAHCVCLSSAFFPLTHETGASRRRQMCVLSSKSQIPRAICRQCSVLITLWRLTKRKFLSSFRGAAIALKKLYQFSDETENLIKARRLVISSLLKSRLSEISFRLSNFPKNYFVLWTTVEIFRAQPPWLSIPSHPSVEGAYGDGTRTLPCAMVCVFSAVSPHRSLQRSPAACESLRITSVFIK